MSTDALPPPDPAMLPDDPAVLKALVVQLLEELQKTQARLERQEHHMHLLLTRLYGSTSEKTDPRRACCSPPRQVKRRQSLTRPRRHPQQTLRRPRRRFPRTNTATGMAAAGFPTKSSARNASTI